MEKFSKVIALKCFTSEDNITHGWLDDPFELFDIFPYLEAIVDKVEDSEEDADIWRVHMRNGEEIDFPKWRFVRRFLIKKGLIEPDTELLCDKMIGVA